MGNKRLCHRRWNCKTCDRTYARSWETLQLCRPRLTSAPFVSNELWRWQVLQSFLRQRHHLTPVVNTPAALQRRRRRCLQALGWWSHLGPATSLGCPQILRKQRWQCLHLVRRVWERVEMAAVAELVTEAVPATPRQVRIQARPLLERAKAPARSIGQATPLIQGPAARAI